MIRSHVVFSFRKQWMPEVEKHIITTAKSEQNRKNKPFRSRLFDMSLKSTSVTKKWVVDG